MIFFFHTSRAVAARVVWHITGELIPCLEPLTVSQKELTQEMSAPALEGREDKDDGNREEERFHPPRLRIC